MAAAPDQHIGLGHWEPAINRKDMRRVLEAAAPHLVMTTWSPQACYAAGVAAERERIRVAILGCLDCGKVHEPRPREGADSHGSPYAPDWADPGNGHAYRVRHFTRAELAGLLRQAGEGGGT